MKKVLLDTGDLQAEIWTLGAAVNDIRVPDREGHVASIVPGYDSAEDRLSGEAYLGEIVGPVANRIAEGGYVIDRVVYTPELNDRGTSTLHGGSGGFSRQEWDIIDQTETSVILGLTWEDATGGFPGIIRTQVAYKAEGSQLTHHISATCDVPTNLNIVSHIYFNLSGTLKPVTDHILQVAAEGYLPIDAASIPFSDAPHRVVGTVFDLRGGAMMEDVLADPHPQIVSQRGLDHAFILTGEGMQRAATLSHPASGRVVQIWTDYPALQVYTSQGMKPTPITHPEGHVGPGCAIALETEGYPDAPRRPDFPSVLVRPTQAYHQETSWRFSIQ